MNSSDPHASSPASGTGTAPPVEYAWKPWARAVASLAIGWHLIGILVTPISVPPQFNGDESVIGTELKKVYEPYITAANLNHSYKFFAPNPGPSHLLRFDLYFADGTKKVNRDDQVLPDRQNHWPRLRYHRHFMLTEFSNLPLVWEIDDILLGAAQEEAARRRAGEGGSPTAGPDANTATPVPLVLAPTTEFPDTRKVPVVDLLDDLDEVIRRREAAVLGERVVPPGAGERRDERPPMIGYWQAAAAYLAKKHGAVRVDLFLRQHSLPRIEQFRAVKRLDPPESYRERLLVSYRVEGAK